MIESRYWKEELVRIAKTLKPVRKPPRWSERGVCVVERDLMIGFFIIRRLIELHKVSPQTRDFNMEVYSCPSQGTNVTLMNNHRIEEHYDLENEILEIKKPLYMSNQFIHAYTSFVNRDETRNWSEVFIVSDFDRNDCIWRVPIPIIQALFELASDDYPTYIAWRFDKKKDDYKVVKIE